MKTPDLQFAISTDDVYITDIRPSNARLFGREAVEVHAEKELTPAEWQLASHFQRHPQDGQTDFSLRSALAQSNYEAFGHGTTESHVRGTKLQVCTLMTSFGLNGMRDARGNKVDPFEELLRLHHRRNLYIAKAVMLPGESYVDTVPLHPMPVSYDIDLTKLGEKGLALLIPGNQSARGNLEDARKKKPTQLSDVTLEPGSNYVGQIDYHDVLTEHHMIRDYGERNGKRCIFRHGSSRHFHNDRIEAQGRQYEAILPPDAEPSILQGTIFYADRFKACTNGKSA